MRVVYIGVEFVRVDVYYRVDMVMISIENNNKVIIWGVIFLLKKVLRYILKKIKLVLFRLNINIVVRVNIFYIYRYLN